MERVELRIFERLSDLDREAWDGLLDAESNPFVSWRFLTLLEETGCAVADRGWWPCHLTAWSNGRLIAAAPAYLKMDSAGDFSRDWGFAELVSRAGVRYYPKMVIGVPFSPVTGRRFLVHPDYDRRALTGLLLGLARELAKSNEVSSIHVLYHHGDECDDLEAAGMSTRILVQYHWKNRSFETADDWLKVLKSKKRTQCRRERAEPAKQGIRLRTVRGEEMQEGAKRWAREAFALYRRNSDKHFWGSAYLTRRFYERVCAEMADCVELVVATRDDRIVAGAFNVATPSHLYGRYWGCHEEYRFLHFNVCLYHSIDECIARGIQVFEGGAGGEHKLSRGFDPTPVFTSHTFIKPEVDDLLSRYFRAESQSRRDQIAEWTRANAAAGRG